jgi:RimJ/RimL family protein N-acetyltransferase
MRVTRHPDAASFLAAAEAFMAEREALHNLPLGVARTCRDVAGRYPGPNYFAVVGDGARIAGIASMTPPHVLQCYVPPGAATDALVADLVAGGWTPPGVHGPVASTEAFSAAWCARRGLTATVHMDLRAFELTATIPAPPAPGRMRVAEAADLPLVQSWYRAFNADARMAPSSATAEEVARRAVGDGRVFLWDDGGPVAQTAIVGTTPNGARIGAVYTPPALRRRGYATALVGAVSQRALDGGKRVCFLFTDLSNPVSNSIYPKVGYRPVADFRDFAFAAAG